MSGIKDALLGDTPASTFYEGASGTTPYRGYAGLPPHQAHSAPSREAAHAIQKHIGPLHERVLKYLREHPEGATDEQIIDALGKPSTIRPRRIELTQQGLVIDSRRYALTKSGRRATVWCLKPQSDRHSYTTLMPPI